MTRILYVDDDDDIREVALMALELDDGLEVRGCASGAEALAVAPMFQPELILLDVMMPQMDGPTTLAKLRADPRTADIAVVFITARTQTVEVEQLKRLGALGVIPKPFDPMTLAEQARAFGRRMNDPFTAKLAERFRLRARTDGDRLRIALDASDRATLGTIAHGLSGTAGTFGFAEISALAAELEEAFEGGAPLDAAAQRLLNALDQL